VTNAGKIGGTVVIGTVQLPCHGFGLPTTEQFTDPRRAGTDLPPHHPVGEEEGSKERRGAKRRPTSTLTGSVPCSVSVR
jgi:hypothetical protein